MSKSCWHSDNDKVVGHRMLSGGKGRAAERHQRKCCPVVLHRGLLGYIVCGSRCGKRVA